MINRRGQITTTVTIDNEDFEWIKARQFKATSLLRSKIKEMRAKDLIDVDSMANQLQRIKDHRDRAIAFIREKDLLDEFVSKE